MIDYIDRLPLILKLRSNGYTLQEIGDTFSLSRERVRQLIKKYNEENPEDAKSTFVSLEMVARRFSIRSRVVRKILDKYGNFTPLHRTSGGRTRWPREIEELIQQYLPPPLKCLGGCGVTLGKGKTKTCGNIICVRKWDRIRFKERYHTDPAVRQRTLRNSMEYKKRKKNEQIKSG